MIDFDCIFVPMPVHLRFGRAKWKSPSELVARVNAALSIINESKSERATERAMDEVSRFLEQIKVPKNPKIEKPLPFDSR